MPRGEGKPRVGVTLLDVMDSLAFVPDGLTAPELADDTGRTRACIYRAIDAAERAGYVVAGERRRALSKGSRQAKSIYPWVLTASGLDRLDLEISLGRVPGVS